jgi:surface protein
MLVKTDNAGTSASNQFTIPTTGAGYNYNVDWGDGNTSTGLTAGTTHAYATAGTYTVKISGDFPQIYFSNAGDRLKVLEVQNWGLIVWRSFFRAFWNCANMNITANDTPDLSAITTSDFYYAFRQCNIQNSSKISDWDVSTINDFRSMFAFNTNFNENLNSWNMSAATNIDGMFTVCTNFNQPLDNWDVSNVVSLSGLFNGCTNFNQPLNSWNTSKNTTLATTFTSCTNFNQPLNNWNTSLVTNMYQTFTNARRFNQDISGWDVSNVISMYYMFSGATDFNQDISGWDVSGCASFQNMFVSSSFNHNIGNWQLKPTMATNGLSAIFLFSGMSVENYTDTIVGWANYVFTNGAPLNLNMGSQVGMTFDTSRSGGANFATAGDARTYLTTTAGWTISGDTVI